MMESAMAESRTKRSSYQLPHRGLLATAFFISLCLFWFGAERLEGIFMRSMEIEVPKSIAKSNSPFWAILAGASFMGGALGAAIGKVFRDQDGDEASIGALIGVIAGPLIVLILLVVFFLVTWKGFP